ncbi:MAG: enoyl-CoA hydratase [Deltaproteobacteria bacterium]|nr:enoyl-CoA hydratase [Deltaproteobacteria bacterium]
MDGPFILSKKEKGVGIITLNRPRALNALNSAMIDELYRAVKEASADEQVKVLILTGAGRAFCFGADVEEFKQAMNARGSALSLLAKSQEIIRLLSSMAKPTIAALNGFATGLGLDLCLACDLRIAAERAKLGEAFVSMGLVPDGGGTYFLPRLVGLARAAEMIFLGKALAPVEALQMGLINRGVPNQELEKAAMEWAETLAKGPSMAIGLAKQALWRNLSGDLEAALRVEAESQKICLQSSDHQEAVKAFVEKRDPVFQGK